jgi:hypothetical protein
MAITAAKVLNNPAAGVAGFQPHLKVFTKSTFDPAELTLIQRLHQLRVFNAFCHITNPIPKKQYARTLRA